MFLACVLLACNVMLASTSTEEGNLEIDRKIWSICAPNGSYACGVDRIRAVKCYEGDAFLHVHTCYCIYWDQDRNKTIVGRCLITCYYKGHPRLPVYPIERYSTLNGTLFNEAMCGISITFIHTHREGRFCGRCKHGYGLDAYSYHYTSCIKCTNYGYKNWFKYFAISLLPLTVFYFLVVTLRVSIASSHLNGIVFIIQCLLSPIGQQVIDGWLNARRSVYYHPFSVVIKIFTSIFGILNLDFFRGVYPHICLHPQLTILHIFSLDYIAALYPFILIFLTYVMVTLYDRDYRLIKFAWKPFKSCLGCYQKEWNIRTSLIETFATFILLSNVKILSISFNILGFTPAYDETGSQLKERFFISDANIEYLGHEHLPFAVLAIFFGFVFVFLPFLLLVLYPCRCFQKCLNCLGWRCQALHIFMDAFQGSYKIEPYDMRYFSAFFLSIRFLFLLIAYATASVIFAPFIFIITLLLGIVIFALFQPYKKSSQNKVDIFVMFLLTLMIVTFSADTSTSYLDSHWLAAANICVSISLVLFCLCSTSIFIWYFFRQKLHKLYNRMASRGLEGDVSNLRSVEIFDRNEREFDQASGKYPPLLNPRK